MASFASVPADGSHVLTQKRNMENESLFDTLEKLVIGAETRLDRSENPEVERHGYGSCVSSTFGGPLTKRELSHLSMICTVAESRDDSVSHSSGNKSTTPRRRGFGSIDGDLLMNLLPLLERHVSAASNVSLIEEACNVFKGRKSRTQDSLNRSSSNIDQWLEGVSNPESNQNLGEGTMNLRVIQNGLEAASITLSIMTSRGVDRRVINEDAIENCISLFRHHLSKNLIPSLSKTGHLQQNKSTSTITPKRRKTESPGSTEHGLARDLRKVYKHVVATASLVLNLMERMDKLICNVPLDDRPLIVVSSTTLSLFCIEPTAAVPNECSFTHLLQVSAINVLTSLARHYERHREILVEDLFPVLLNLPKSKRWLRTYPLPDSGEAGALSNKNLSARRLSFADEQGTVQPITILLLSVIQSCVVMPTWEQIENDQMDQEDPTEESQKLPKNLKSGLEQCQAFSILFAKQLIHRCARKGGDGGASEFRPVLANLVDDLLELQLVPEYPAAEILLRSFCATLGNEILKAASGATNLSVESTFLSAAFDAFGKVNSSLARIIVNHRTAPLTISEQPQNSTEESSSSQPTDGNRCHCGRHTLVEAFMVSCDRCNGWFHGECVGLSKESLESVWYCEDCQLKMMALEETRRFAEQSVHQRGDNSALNDGFIPKIIETHVFRQLVLMKLSGEGSPVKSNDLDSARDFALASWISKLHAISRQETEGKPARDSWCLSDLLCRHLLGLWGQRQAALPATEGRGNRAQLPSLRREGYLRLMTALAATTSELVLSFPQQMGLIMQAMSDNAHTSVRKLAVKSIAQVLDADPQLMMHPHVQKVVAARFHDEAKSVREAIVALVGSYVTNVPEVANVFHSALLPRLTDSGVSVRKRTVKIFREVLLSNPGYKGRAAACAIMLFRAADRKEDDSVRDLIHELFTTMWLEGGSVLTPGSDAPKVRRQSRSSENDSAAMKNDGGGSLDVMVVTPASSSPVAESFTSPEPTTDSKPTSSDSYYAHIKSNIEARCRIAAEQMIEVVLEAGSNDVLSSFLRDLIFGFSDADKDRRISERKRRRTIASEHCFHLVNALLEHLVRLEEEGSDNKVEFEKQVVATVKTIGVFAEVAPNDVVRHIDTLLPYLKAENGISNAAEADVVGEVCEILYRCRAVISKNMIITLSERKVCDDLVKVTYRFPSATLGSAVRALASLSQHAEVDEVNVFREKMMKLSITFYSYLFKNMDLTDDFSKVQVKIRSNVQRALSVLGAICQNHEPVEGESDDWLVEIYEEVEHEAEDKVTWGSLIENCYYIFTAYLQKLDGETKCGALRALGGIFLSRPRLLLALEQAGTIEVIMSDKSPAKLRVQALKCWRDILLAEEKRVESGEAMNKMESNANITLSKKISGDQDGDATLVGGVLSQHAQRLFRMTLTSNISVRFAAVDLLGHLLRQGLINPMDAVPYLFGLQGDVEAQEIRSLALKLLTTEGEKRPDMLRQRICAGVKQAYRFQRALYPTRDPIATVLTKCDGAQRTECIFSSVFIQCIRSRKNQKQGLFNNLLGLFEVDDGENVRNGSEGTEMKRKQTQSTELPLLCFASEVLAYLPYNTANDPLYIIHRIQSLAALQGVQLIDRLSSFLQKSGVANVTVHDELNAEEDSLELAAQTERPSASKEAEALTCQGFDTKQFTDLCTQATSFVLLLRLKAFLRSAYNLSEARCLDFKPETKERNSDKLTGTFEIPFNNLIPKFASVESGEDAVANLDNLILQYAEFRMLMRQEQGSDTRTYESDDEVASENDGKKRKVDTNDEDEYQHE